MRFLSLSAAALGLLGSAFAQQVPIPAFVSTYTGAQTRGFWFQAPATGLVITIAVPNEALQPFQAVEFIDLGTTPPPAYPATVNGTQLYYSNNTPGGSTISVAIPIIAGNYYGVLGACTGSVGSANSYNSYDSTGTFASSVLGIPTTLTRFGTQFGIGAGGNNPCWSEAAGTLCRVDIGIVPATGGVIATNTTTGAGCINIPDVSSYENFASAAAFDLSNTSMSWLRAGNGYLALPGISTYVPPSATAQVLALTDDSETTVTLSQAMPVGSSSSTSTLTVCSNGFISAGTGNGTAYTPTPATFLNSPQAWWSLAWHDFNPGLTGSGQVKFEQIGNTAYVTWDGVWDYGGTSAANACTFQAQFDVTTGSVNVIYQTMSTLGNAFLTGFSDGGASADPGSMDISAALPATYSLATFRVLPLTLTGGSRPITGTNWNLNVTNVPATGAIGIDIFGLGDPGINDLAFLGAPTCGIRASLDLLNAWIVTGSSHGYGLALPNHPSLYNVHLYTTSAVLQPGVNTFLGGVITANGIDGNIGNL